MILKNIIILTQHASRYLLSSYYVGGFRKSKYSTRTYIEKRGKNAAEVIYIYLMRLLNYKIILEMRYTLHIQ